MSTRVDRIVAWGLIGFGLLHSAVTFVFYKSVTDAALWFFSAGMALIFAGLLNLVPTNHSRFSLERRPAQVANVILLAFVLVYAGRDPLRSLTDPASILLLLLVGTATFLSFFRL